MRLNTTLNWKAHLLVSYRSAVTSALTKRMTLLETLVSDETHFRRTLEYAMVFLPMLFHKSCQESRILHREIQTNTCCHRKPVKPLTK